MRDTLPQAWTDPYSDMDSIEKSKLIIELTRMRAEDQRRFDSLLEKLDAMTQAQLESSAEASKLRSEISNLVKQLQDKDKELKKALSKIRDLEEQHKLSNKTTYGSKSQKSRKDKDSGHDDNMLDRQQRKDAKI